MADYYPPTENLPIFDVSAFRATNDNNITQDDADRMYLSRQGVASSLATSTNFLGTLSCGGNLTLNAPTAALRQIEASFLKLRDNASISTNRPLIWYPDPSLQITTNDVLGAVKTIDLKSYDGSATDVSTTLTCKYGEVALGGTLKISQITNTANNSTINMNSTNLTITNTNATGSILLNTTAGAIITNSIFVPSDNVPAIISSRPSIGYAYSGSIGPTTIIDSNPINQSIVTPFPIGVYLFEASVVVTKSTSTFSATGTSSIRLSYIASPTYITFAGLNTAFENLYPDNTVTGITPCGVVGGSRVMNILQAYGSGTGLTVQAANWATYAGTPTYTIRWSAVRIA
jgi:hypothetical protein